MVTKSAGRKEVSNSMERKMLEREEKSKSNKWNNEVEPPKKVAVIYYLSRNGQLEHPHLMEVPLSSPQGILCLKDVMNKLNSVRGQGMASMYSWSTKRSYKNGFVWQDLCESDFIYPSSGHDEYVLKGTQLVIETNSLSFRSYETISTPSSKSSSETNNVSSIDAESPAGTITKGRNSSCDYKLYKAKTCRGFTGKAANASTQTEEEKGSRQKVEIMERKELVKECEGNDYAIEFFSENIGGSLMCSTSSFGSCDEGSLKGGYRSADIRNQRVENERPSGRMKASAVLMHLIRCRLS